MRAVRGALRRGRRNAESLFIDHCEVERVETVEDPDDGTTSTRRVPVWTGPCKMTTYEPDPIVIESGGRPMGTQEYRLHVPIGAGPFRMGDVATIDGYPEVFRIDGLLRKTWATAQRLEVTEIGNVPEVIEP